MLSQLLLCTGFFGLIVLPGVGLIALARYESGWPRLIAIGSTAALATAVLAGYYLLFARLPFVYFIVLEYAAWAIAFLFLRHPTGSQPSERAGRRQHRGDFFLLLLLVLVFVSRSVPLFFSEAPPRLDPCFHTLIAKKILLSGTIPSDWTPFETVRLNYPVGSHILVAETARLTGAPIHQVFKALFPILACLTTLLIYCVALRLLEGGEAAWFTAVAYSFLGVWGSLDYYRWGGLPNLLGMLLLLGLVDATFTKASRYSITLFALLFAALFISHHHSVLCAGIIFLAYAMLVGALAKRLDGTARTILLGLGCAGLLCLVPLSSYVRGGGEVGQTSVLQFYEPLIPLWDGVLYLGVPLVILGVAGTVSLLRTESNERHLFLIFWIATLFAVFAFLEYAYRFGAYAYEKQFYSAFTPGRFLTNLAYPLSVAAGFLLSSLVGKVRGNVRAFVAPLATLGLALAWSYPTLREQCVDTAVDVDAFSWIQGHTEENAFIISGDPWAPYFTWREGAYTALPASEARNHQSVVAKRELLQGDLAAITQFAKTSRRPVYVAVPVEAPRTNALNEVYSGQKTRVYKVR